ncbi:hypothetical protein ABZX40_13220 [Streptomyces sp. NPDC004610]|uniref:hypothetical protein n=1 Tax=unclassified Streptomyces TaxID=2593676 RepID=UPI0033B16B2D
MTITTAVGATAPAAGPQCPEALYSPATDTLRRCVLGPHAGTDSRAWHETKDGIQWRHTDTEPKEGPEWMPPF